jgi:alkylation response protein AidB-like acyl-CoA dehydrogenase
VLEQHHSAQALERFLGDPLDVRNVFSFKRLVALDEQDAYPEEACDLLNNWKFHHYYVPQECGGKLTSYEELLALLRVVSRRDLTVAIAHGKTYLGSMCIWVGGNKAQQEKLASLVRKGEQVALGLTEPAHGSDLLADELQAVPTADGYRLSGEKWLINNATRGSALTVFARIDPKGGPRGFSLFLVEKASLNPAGLSHLPKVRTHGIRGADISGIRFEDCGIPREALVGAEGSGLEVTLKALQISRTMCAALSLGAADTALRATVDFAASRRLYGGLYGESVFAMPHARRILVEAFTDLLICECVAVTAVRALHLATEEMSVISAIVKYFVPATVDALLRNVSIVLGGRHYWREVHWEGIFQKLLRDHGIVGLFDGSSAVNLHALGLQLKPLLEQCVVRAGSGAHASGEAVFSLKTQLPPFDPGRLMLSARGHDLIGQALEDLLAGLEAKRGREHSEPDTTGIIIALTRAIVERSEEDARALRELELREGAQMFKAAELFALSHHYCARHAAAACLGIWLYNRTWLDPEFRDGAWLALCLRRLLKTWDPRPPGLPPVYEDRVAEELLKRYQRDQLFSLTPFSVGERKIRKGIAVVQHGTS